MDSSASFLLSHFDRLAEAPGGLAKLRALILQLAVQGKLGTQNSKDEPAEKLRDRIFAEKKRLIAAGKLGRDKDWSQEEDFAAGFDLPTSWVFSTLAEIGWINPRNDVEDDQDASFVPMKLINAELREPHGHEVHKWAEIKKGFTHFAEGDVALAKITPCFENRKSSVMRGLANGVGTGTTELHVVRPVFVDSDYILIFLKSPIFVEAGIPKMTGTAGQKRVPTPYFAASPFPLPPLAEQRRIVTKVEELMGLCDALETAQRERETVRTCLRTSALHRLTAPDTDPKSAAFVLQHLPRFTFAPDDIASLRQSILQFAVTGRLGRDQSGWRDCKLGEIAVYGPKNGVSPKASPVPTKTKSLSLSATTSGVFKGEYFKYVDLEPEKDSELWLCDGDILIQRSNTREYVGTAAIYRGAPNQFIYPDLMMRLRVADTVDVNYIHRVLSAPITRAYFSKAASGSSDTMPKINQEAVRNTPIPLPPLAEQRRIVAKVDELMAVLDALEAALTTARATAESLLAATVARLSDSQLTAEFAEVIDFQSSPEFIRATLAAQVTDQMRDDRHFGQTKLQKIIYLVEHLFRLPEIDSHHVRYARGPHDPKLIEQAETGMKNCEWFEAVPRDNGKGKEYHALSQNGGQRVHFEKLWAAQAPAIRGFIDTMKTWNTERCERFATVFAAWNDLLVWGESVTDAAILQEVLQHWHSDKLKIPKSDWEDTLSWMRREGHIPIGWGRATKARREPELFPA